MSGYQPHPQEARDVPLSRQFEFNRIAVFGSNNFFWCCHLPGDNTAFKVVEILAGPSRFDEFNRSQLGPHPGLAMDHDV